VCRLSASLSSATFPSKSANSDIGTNATCAVGDKSTRSSLRSAEYSIMPGIAARAGNRSVALWRSGHLPEVLSAGAALQCHRRSHAYPYWARRGSQGTGQRAGIVGGLSAASDGQIRHCSSARCCHAASTSARSDSTASTSSRRSASVSGSL